MSERTSKSQPELPWLSRREDPSHESDVINADEEDDLKIDNTAEINSPDVA